VSQICAWWCFNIKNTRHALLGVSVVKSVDKVHYYDFGSFRLDLLNRELLKNGVHVSITQKSFELLQFLIENRGRGLRKNEILNNIWTESYVEEANLAQHIYMIRKVLKDNGNTEKYIETIPKYGYRFNGEVFESSGNETPLQRAIISDSSANEKPKNEIIIPETNTNARITKTAYHQNRQITNPPEILIIQELLAWAVS